MGSEDLFHKRKARSAKAPARQKTERAKNPRYLIVCEGTKTEPNYFKALLNDWRISSKVVQIEPNNGSSPDRIVEHAVKLYDDDIKSGDSFDRVYCIFDRDDHTTFSAAIQSIDTLGKNKRKPRPFTAITSNPCFEFWLLLHFEYSAAPFYAIGNKSVGDQVISRLKQKHGFENYGKGHRDVYEKLKDKLPFALKNVECLRQSNLQNNSVNPSTDVDFLVRALQDIVEKRKCKPTS